MTPITGQNLLLENCAAGPNLSPDKACQWTGPLSRHNLLADKTYPTKPIMGQNLLSENCAAGPNLSLDKACQWTGPLSRHNLLADSTYQTKPIG
jgi:hypothetical protein